MRPPNPVADLLLALSFLTRLAPARQTEAADLARTIRLFPVAGLVLGAAATMPFALGLLADHTLLAGWALLALSLVLTRGLHADGLADIADAWGSGARGEAFWRVLKDSRCGAFAVIGLILVLGAQGLALGRLLDAGDPGAILMGFIAGRFAMVALAHTARPLARPGLGGTFLAGADRPALIWAAIQYIALGLILLPPASLALATALSAVPVLALSLLGKREHGLNGDFLGACCLACELATWLAAL